MVQITRRGASGTAEGLYAAIADKTPADYPASGLLVDEFDLLRQGYAGAIVSIFRAGTTQLQDCYSDPFLTKQIPNPQTLSTKVFEDGSSFGGFLQRVYVPFSYELDVNNYQQTGVHARSLEQLDGEDASYASVTARTGAAARSLRDVLADDVRLLDFGPVSKSPESNTNTLNKAMAEAARRGGARVILPPQAIDILTITLPAKVLLVGAGRDITVLRSHVADRVIVLTGDDAGLYGLTLDGVELYTGSVGVYGLNRRFACGNVTVKRFDRGLYFQGGRDHRYDDLTVTNCNRGFLAIGDTDFTNTGKGGDFVGLDWFRGEVSAHTVSGVELVVRDALVTTCCMRQLSFEDNPGTDGALLLSAARITSLDSCSWSGNNINLAIEDNPDPTLDIRHLAAVQVYGGSMTDGRLLFDGLAQDVIFDQFQFDNVTFEANVPTNEIVLRDCIESAALITGDGTKISRWRTSDNATVKGTTVDATPVVVFRRTLAPNECVIFDVTASGERQNGIEHGAVKTIQAARGAPALLNFDEQTVNFAVGDDVVGQSSGAIGTIVAQSDAGATGQLSLAKVAGDFVDNEVITGAQGGRARVNGVLIGQAGSLLGAASTQLSQGTGTSSALPTGWAVTFRVLNQEFQALVTGAASTEIDWCVKIAVTRF